jgi:hypothetical protein
MKTQPMRTLSALLLCATLSLGGCTVQDDPAAAARSWTDALADGDGMRLAELTCDSAQGDLQTSMLMYSALGVVSSMLLEGAKPQTSVDELAYDTTHDDGTRADVRVSGRMRVGLLMTSSSQTVDDVFHLQFERDAWRVCGSERHVGP